MDKRNDNYIKTSDSNDNAVIQDIAASESNIDAGSDKTFPVLQQKNNMYDKDIYTAEIAKYSDIIISPNSSDSNYLAETVFIGDSNTAGLAAFGYLPLQNVLGKKSMGIQGVVSNKFIWFKGFSQPVDIVTAVGLLKPRRVIINFGTNNTVGISTQDFIKIYRNAIAAVREIYPYCDIIVAAVLPVGYYRENYNIAQSTIDSFNLALAQLCSEINCSFLDYSEVFKNPETGYMQSDCVASDGIHLNSKGYRLLLEYVTSHQIDSPDCRPDTDNIPVRINSPEALSGEAPANAGCSGYYSDNNIDSNEMVCDNNNVSSVPTDSSMSQNSSETDNASGSQPDLGNISSEKIIYDPFL